jgi:asparagine synthase (glutamine-hydrolysing)
MIQKVKKAVSKIWGPFKEKKLLSRLDPMDRELILQIRKKNLTYLSNTKLISIANTCKTIEEANLPGIFIEAGCALGGSSILISKMKSRKRSFNIYDVFGMIPPPTSEDTQDVHDRFKVIADGKSPGLGENKYYGYEENLYEMVLNNLKDFGIDTELQSVSLVKGLVQDTLKIDGMVAFAHIDVDWYDPVKTCLERIFPQLVIGGSLILDDYFVWGGCKKATDEYLLGVESQYALDDSYSSLKITRIK